MKILATSQPTPALMADDFTKLTSRRDGRQYSRTTSRTLKYTWRCSGQALIEFVFVAAILLLVTFGLIDFCRAISARLVITNLAREGSNLASRNTPITNAVNAIIAAAAPLDINAHGRVIITAVAADKTGTLVITNQLRKGSASLTSYDSKTKVGLGKGTVVSSGWIPTTTPSLPVSNQTVWVTEVFYEYNAATPIGKYLGVTLPSPLYDVAYF